MTKQHYITTIMLFCISGEKAHQMDEIGGLKGLAGSLCMIICNIIGCTHLAVRKTPRLTEEVLVILLPYANFYFKKKKETLKTTT